MAILEDKQHDANFLFAELESAVRVLDVALEWTERCKEGGCSKRVLCWVSDGGSSCCLCGRASDCILSGQRL